MQLVAKNKNTGENVITVEEWLATVNNPTYTEAWDKRAEGPTPIFDEVWNTYLEAVNAELVEEEVHVTDAGEA